MRHGALVVLCVSGLLGFRLGMVAFPDWQVAVETAQVIAGVVQYPVATPFFIYHTKLWTVLHQVLAVFLRMGVSEIRLSLILSGVLGMVSFQALAMFVFALSQDVLLAAGAPLVVAAARATDFGVAYPINLMGASHTYGILGLSLLVLIVALLGAGCYRSGGFLLGLMPSVHPSLGFWLFVIVAICFVWDFRRLRSASGPAAWYFVAGGLLSTASFIVQLTSAYHGPPVDATTTARHLTAFFAFWDAHRQPVSLALNGVRLNVGALALAALWLAALATDVPKSAALLLRVVAVSAALSLVMVMMSWIPASQLPASLLILMPTRVANFNAMTFVVLLFGLIGAYRTRAWSPLMALFFTAALLAGSQSMLWPWLHERGKTAELSAWTHWFDLPVVLTTASIALTTFALWNATRRRAASRPSAEPLWIRMLTIAARFALACVFLVLAAAAWKRSAPTLGLFDNYTNDPVFRVASEGDGLLATGGGLHLIQLRTRRPVLLDGGGLDGLPYAPESGPAMASILRDVYEIDFFNPPEEARRAALIPPLYNKTVWERFSPEKWRQIRYLYQVHQVLTDANWSLRLPVMAQNRILRLYEIPD